MTTDKTESLALTYNVRINLDDAFGILTGLAAIVREAATTRRELVQLGRYEDADHNRSIIDKSEALAARVIEAFRDMEPMDTEDGDQAFPELVRYVDNMWIIETGRAGYFLDLLESRGLAYDEAGDSEEG